MCGIVGYIGPRIAQDFLLEGLRRLEYRGYDSAGTATIDRATGSRASASLRGSEANFSCAGLICFVCQAPLE